MAGITIFLFLILIYRRFRLRIININYISDENILSTYRIKPNNFLISKKYLSIHFLEDYQQSLFIGIYSKNSMEDMFNLL